MVTTLFFYAPQKSSLEWFATAHKGVWVDSWFDVQFVSVFLLGSSKLNVFQNILRYIFTAHLVGLIVNYIQSFPTKQKRSEMRVLDLTSNQESTQTPLCAVANQNEGFSRTLKSHKYSRFHQSKKFLWQTTPDITYF